MMNHLRVSVGTPEDMDRFMVAFKKVMGEPDDDRTAAAVDRDMDRGLGNRN